MIEIRQAQGRLNMLDSLTDKDFPKGLAAYATRKAKESEHAT